MHKQVGICAAAALYYSGLVGLSRWFMQNSGRRLIILNYHGASGGDLERHMLYLRRHYRMMHLEDALIELYQPHAERQTRRDRRTPLVLTFDDGYHDNYTHAFALARKLRVPITIFLIPGYIESGQTFWWKEGRRLVHDATVDKVLLEERLYDLRYPDEREQLADTIDHHLRYACSVAERESALATFRRLLAVPETSTCKESERPLTWEEIREMQESGWVSFGGHTMHHPILGYLSDPAEVRSEIAQCRSVLEQRLGLKVRSFAYPVGRKEHIGNGTVQAVREAGFSWAVTTLYAVNTPETNPLMIGRVLGDVQRHWLFMAAETSGIWHFLRRLLCPPRGFYSK